MNRTLGIQLFLLGGCAALLGIWAAHFPYPAPMVRPLLPPKLRWPTEQIREWATATQKEGANLFRPDFWEFFTRDPERAIPAGENIVSPADGKFLNHDFVDGRQYVVVALSFWDVHVVRAPCDGVVTKIEDGGDAFIDGEGRDAAYLREKMCPVQKIVTMQTAWGEFKVRLITSLAARRLEVWVKEEQELAKGQRLGRILAGSTVVLEMPTGLTVDVAVDQRLEGGTTILHREAK